MKHIMFLFAALLLAQVTMAQEIETLAGKGPKYKSLGAYGALNGKVTTFDGKFAVLSGGYGGVFLNKKHLLGLGGYSLNNRIRTGVDNRDWNMWYCGAVYEYVFNTDKLFHFSAGALLGGGGVSQRTHFRHDRDNVHGSSGFAVAEPFINAEMNISKYIRVFAGGSWRQAFGTNSGVGISDAKISAPSFQLGVKAGIF